MNTSQTPSTASKRHLQSSKDTLAVHRNIMVPYTTQMPTGPPHSSPGTSSRRESHTYKSLTTSPTLSGNRSTRSPTSKLVPHNYTTSSPNLLPMMTTYSPSTRIRKAPLQASRASHTVTLKHSRTTSTERPMTCSAPCGQHNTSPTSGNNAGWSPSPKQTSSPT